MTGTLYGIGVGPGDPELLTLKAARLIGQCPVLAYPANRDGVSQARAIAAAHIADGVEEIPMAMDFTPDRDSANAAYDAACEAFRVHLAAGRDVAVLCEGDPLLFGSFIYVLDRLAGFAPIEVVPGITSVTAAPGALAMPLTRGDDRLVVLPATRDADDLAEALKAAEAAVILKVGRHLDKVRTVLANLGLDNDAWLAENVGRDTERLTPLKKATEAPYFSVIVARR